MMNSATDELLRKGLRIILLMPSDNEIGDIVEADEVLISDNDEACTEDGACGDNFPDDDGD